MVSFLKAYLEREVKTEWIFGEIEHIKKNLLPEGMISLDTLYTIRTLQNSWASIKQ